MIDHALIDQIFSFLVDQLKNVSKYSKMNLVNFNLSGFQRMNYMISTVTFNN